MGFRKTGNTPRRCLRILSGMITFWGTWRMAPSGASGVGGSPLGLRAPFGSPITDDLLDEQFESLEAGFPCVYKTNSDEELREQYARMARVFRRCRWPRRRLPHQPGSEAGWEEEFARLRAFVPRGSDPDDPLPRSIRTNASSNSPNLPTTWRTGACRTTVGAVCYP